MKKVLAFDLDGTLAPSKSALPDKISELMGSLLVKYNICVISGGKFEQFSNQLLANLHLGDQELKNLHIMPTCGTRYYKYDQASKTWKKVYAEDFSNDQKKKIIVELSKVIESLGYNKHKVYGEQIEDRGSQISWSALGQNIVDELGEEGVRLKEEWDPTNAKKSKIRELVAPKLPEFEVRMGGTTTIDITKQGIDKAYGMRKLMQYLKVEKEDILFFGDKLNEGGNDFPVKAMGIDCLEVSDWHDTAFALQAIVHVV